MRHYVLSRGERVKSWLSAKEERRSLRNTHVPVFRSRSYSSSTIRSSYSGGGNTSSISSSIYSSSRTARKYKCNKRERQQRQFNDKRQAVEAQHTYWYTYYDTTPCAAAASSIQEPKYLVRMLLAARRQAAESYVTCANIHQEKKKRVGKKVGKKGRYSGVRIPTIRFVATQNGGGKVDICVQQTGKPRACRDSCIYQVQIKVPLPTVVLLIHVLSQNSRSRCTTLMYV